MNKTDKVYIVVSGSYSDFSIEQVFLDEKIAEEYAYLVNGVVREYSFFDEKARKILDENEYFYSLTSCAHSPRETKNPYESWVSVREEGTKRQSWEIEEYIKYEKSKYSNDDFLKLRKTFKEKPSENLQKKFEDLAVKMYLKVKEKIKQDNLTVEEANEWLNTFNFVVLENEEIAINIKQ